MPFLDELAAKLVADGVGVIGTSIFLSSKAEIPAGAGPYISIIETGGMTARRNHNNKGYTQRPSAQITTRASTYPAARSKAFAAYTSLCGDRGLFNTTLSGVFYLSIIPIQHLIDIGLDEAARPRVAFNIDVEKHPS